MLHCCTLGCTGHLCFLSHCLLWISPGVMSQSAAPCCIDLTSTRLQLLASCHSRSQWYSLLSKLQTLLLPGIREWPSSHHHHDFSLVLSSYQDWIKDKILIHVPLLCVHNTTQWKFHKSCTHTVQPGARDVFSLCGGARHGRLQQRGKCTIVQLRDRDRSGEYTSTAAYTCTLAQLTKTSLCFPVYSSKWLK